MIQELLDFYGLENYDKTINRKDIRKYTRSKNKSPSVRPETNNNTNNTQSKEIKQKEDLKYKKRLEKLIPKTEKGIDLQKFLEREYYFEQKRQYNLEMMRNKQREETRKNVNEIPIISKNSQLICDRYNYKPILTKTTEISRLKQVPKYSKTEIPEEDIPKKQTKEITTEYPNKERFESWYDRVMTYSSNAKEKRHRARTQEKEKKIEEEKEYFFPKISEVSEKIVRKNREKSIDNNLSLDKLRCNLLNTEPLYLNTNIGEDKFIRKHSMDFLSLKNAERNKNKRKYKNKRSNLYKAKSIEEIPKSVLDRIQEERSKRYLIKSMPYIDRRKKESQSLDVMEIGSVRKKPKIEHWTQALKRIENKQKSAEKEGIEFTNSKKVNEILYKLNIFHAAAWNENDLNNVNYWGESKDIVKKFIDYK